MPSGDPAPGIRTIQPPVDSPLPVPAQGSRTVAFVGFAFFVQERVGLHVRRRLAWQPKGRVASRDCVLRSPLPVHEGVPRSAVGCSSASGINTTRDASWMVLFSLKRAGAKGLSCGGFSFSIKKTAKGFSPARGAQKPYP